jgi:hypothetical protein
MRIGPGVSSQVARASGVQPARSTPRTGGTAHADPTAGAGSPEQALARPVSRLVGAVVPGKVSFTGDAPVQEGAIALYRHPADKNAAATGVYAGRVVDVTA